MQQRTSEEETELTDGEREQALGPNQSGSATPPVPSGDEDDAEDDEGEEEEDEDVNKPASEE